jgi:prepilin-type N-terminal cleavage/methylation domain-containing protein
MKSSVTIERVEQGFTLIEIAIVLLIVTILLGYSVALFPVQQELKQYRKLDRDMDNIVDHLIGFAQVNGRLPCPDTNGDLNSLGAGTINGQEDPDDLVDNVDTLGAAPPTSDGIIDSCKGFFGFLPAGTLGLTGNIDSLGRLLDPWGQPYLYHVSNIDFNSVGGAGGIDADIDTLQGADLVSPNGIGEEGLSNVEPNLSICTDSNNITATDVVCDGSGTSIVTNAAAVVISSGKDTGQLASDIQDENRDDFNDGTNDLVYTFSTNSDVSGAEYDDRVRWISPNLLYSKMIEAGQLP